MKIPALFKNKSFLNLWTGQLISALGDRLTQMGILTFVMVASGDDGSKMALITFFSLLPFLIFGPLFGVMVDRYSRKNIMLITDLLRAIFVIFIPIIWIKTGSEALVILVVFILGALTGLFTPAKMSIIGNIVSKENLLEANSLVATTGMIATLIGTLLAGLIIKFTGPKTGFYINSFTYIMSAVFILGIFYKKSQDSTDSAKNIYRTLINDIKVGIKFTKKHKTIMNLMLLSSFFSLITSIAYILVINYSTKTLNEGAFGIGVLLSAAGFGMIVGSLILIKRKDKVSYNRALYISNFLIGIFLFAFIFKPMFLLSLIVLFFTGLGVSILTIALDTLFQRVVPDELMGKIFATRGILTNAVFLAGLLLIGFLVKIFSATILFGIIGISEIIVAIMIISSEKDLGYRLFRVFLKILMKVLFSLKVSGLENIPKTKRVILAGNHTSFIDGAAAACAYPKRLYFFAGDSAFNTKFIGWFAKHLGFIHVKTGFNKEAIKKAVEILKSGAALGIFPEGKLSLDGNPIEAKPGIAVIAKLADANIIPFAIEGAHEAWPAGKKFFRRSPVEVRFGKPIDISGFITPQELTKEVMEEISKVKKEIEKDGYLSVEPSELVKHIINIG